MYINNYISDNISDEEIAKWEGKNVLITADTGLGKTTFIDKKLVDYANSVNKSILCMCNRIALRKQVEEEFEKIGVDLSTYQHFEKNIEKIEEYLTENYILVLDEAHYFGTDAIFNPKSQLLYEKLIMASNEKVFMTATPECLYLDEDFFQYKYEYKRNLNNYIDKCYYYNSNDIILNMINNIPPNEKVLYMCTNIKTIQYLADKLGDKASVLIANSEKNEVLYEKYHCEDAFSEIVNESKFSSQILLATTCIDNGVSLKMKELKHIIIDIANPITVKQAIGRKRFMDINDKINLYIKNWYNDQLQGIINKKKPLYKMIDFWNDNGKDKFIEKYKIEEYNTKLFYIEKENGQVTVKLNKCYSFSLLYQKEVTSLILNQSINSSQKYLNYICNYLDIPISKFISLEYEHDYEILKSFIMEHNNEKIYKDSPEYNELRHILLKQLLSNKKKTFGLGNVKKVIAWLNSKQTDYNFSIISEQESGGKYRKVQYWIISCIETVIPDSTSSLPNIA